MKLEQTYNSLKNMPKKRKHGVGLHHHYIRLAQKIAKKLAKLDSVKVVLPHKIVPTKGPNIIRVQRSLPSAVRLFVSSGEGGQEISVIPTSEVSIEQLEKEITILLCPESSR